MLRKKNEVTELLRVKGMIFYLTAIELKFTKHQTDLSDTLHAQICFF